MSDASQLVQAYCFAIYRVAFAASVVDIRIGEFTPITNLSENSKWIVITAFNPASTPCEDSINQAANARLRARLLELGATLFEAMSQSVDGSWQEPSFFAMGLTLEQADELAKSFGQHGIVFGQTGEPARLRLYGPDFRTIFEPNQESRMDTRFIVWVP